MLRCDPAARPTIEEVLSDPTLAAYARGERGAAQRALLRSLPAKPTEPEMQRCPSLNEFSALQSPLHPASHSTASPFVLQPDLSELDADLMSLGGHSSSSRHSSGRSRTRGSGGGTEGASRMRPRGGSASAAARAAAFGSAPASASSASIGVAPLSLRAAFDLAAAVSTPSSHPSQPQPPPLLMSSMDGSGGGGGSLDASMEEEEEDGGIGGGCEDEEDVESLAPKNLFDAFQNAHDD